MQVTLIHNPLAGKGQATKKELLVACKLAGVEAAYFSAKGDDLKKALDQRTDMVVVAGGDGTVSRVATEMLHRKVPLAIVPLGNANNIARSFGIAGSLHELAESWAQGCCQSLDIGLVYGSWGSRKFVEAVGLGPFAHVIENNEQSDKKHGAENLRHGRKQLLQAFKDAEGRRYRLILDSREVKGRFIAIEIANIAYTGPGLRLAPKSDPGDNVLDVICVKAADRSKIVDWLDAPHESLQPLRAKRGRQIAFCWQEGSLRIDDDVLPAPKAPEEVRVELAGAIEIVVPVKAGSDETGKDRRPRTASKKR